MYFSQVLVGTSTGKLALWDFRHGEGYKGQIRKYKGCTGAIKGLYHVPGTEYFGAVGLDRHLRVYTLKGTSAVHQSTLRIFQISLVEFYVWIFSTFIEVAIFFNETPTIMLCFLPFSLPCLFYSIYSFYSILSTFHMAFNYLKKNIV